MIITIIDDNGQTYSKVLPTGKTGNSPVSAINAALHLFQDVYTPFHVSSVLARELDPELFQHNKTLYNNYIN